MVPFRVEFIIYFRMWLPHDWASSAMSSVYHFSPMTYAFRKSNWLTWGLQTRIYKPVVSVTVTASVWKIQSLLHYRKEFVDALSVNKSALPTYHPKQTVEVVINSFLSLLQFSPSWSGELITSHLYWAAPNPLLLQAQLSHKNNLD